MSNDPANHRYVGIANGIRLMVAEMLAQAVQQYRAHVLAGIIVNNAPNPERMARKKRWNPRKRHWFWSWCVVEPLDRYIYPKRADIQELCDFFKKDGGFDRWSDLARMKINCAAVRDELGIPNT